MNETVKVNELSDENKTVYLNEEPQKKTDSTEMTVYLNNSIVDDSPNTKYVNETKKTYTEKTHYINEGDVNNEESSQTVLLSDNTEYIETQLEEDISSCEGVEIPEQTDEAEYKYYLPSDTQLNNRYKIIEVLGEGGFGITYQAIDTTLDINVAIKEYYPSNIVARNTAGNGTSEVTIRKDSIQVYTEGKSRVLDEARRVASFRDNYGIVGIQDFFEENNTAYIVLEYVEGVTIDKYVKENGLSADEIIKLLMPIFDSLCLMHEAGMIHRDISPDNIMVNKNGNAKLLDFGAARNFENTAKSMSVVLKQGYAPEEQYRTKGNQGPWTDVYALAATMYKLLSGITPSESLDRLAEDDVVEIKELNSTVNATQNDAIMKAMAIKASDRWQNIREFEKALSRGGINADNKDRDQLEADATNADSKKRTVYFTLILLGVLAISFVALRMNSKKERVAIENPEIEDGDEQLFEAGDEDAISINYEEKPEADNGTGDNITIFSPDELESVITLDGIEYTTAKLEEEIEQGPLKFEFKNSRIVYQDRDVTLDKCKAKTGQKIFEVRGTLRNVSESEIEISGIKSQLVFDNTYEFSDNVELFVKSDRIYTVYETVQPLEEREFVIAAPISTDLLDTFGKCDVKLGYSEKPGVVDLSPISSLNNRICLILITDRYNGELGGEKREMSSLEHKDNDSVEKMGEEQWYIETSLGEKVITENLEITFEDAYFLPKEAVVDRKVADEEKCFYAIKTKIKNIGGDNIANLGYRAVANSLIFDSKYKYETSGYNYKLHYDNYEYVKAEAIEPLCESEVYFIAELPDELIDNCDTVEFKMAFHDIVQYLDPQARRKDFENEKEKIFENHILVNVR